MKLELCEFKILFLATCHLAYGNLFRVFQESFLYPKKKSGTHKINLINPNNSDYYQNS